MSRYGRNAVEMIKEHIGEPRLIAEVGIWRGVSTEVVLEAFPHVSYVAIDPYKVLASDHPFRAHKFGRMEQKEYDLARHEAVERLARFDHVWWIFMRDDQLELDRYGPFDVVLLDANHNKEDVATQMRRWFPHVADGGLLIGDDYGGSHKGVAAAVDEYVEEFGATLITRPGRTWCIPMPSIADSARSVS